MTEDASLIAGGFSESFIKIWSLKGEKLRGLRNTVNPAHVNDRKFSLLFYINSWFREVRIRDG